MRLADFQTEFYRQAFNDLADGGVAHTESPLSEAHLSDSQRLFSTLQPGRLAQYRWMVYANYADTLETIFPYTFKLLKSQWPELVRQYLSQYPPTHYQLYGAALAFPQFVSEQSSWVQQYPFLKELAGYELLEATVLRMPNEPLSTVFLKSLTQVVHPLEAYSPVINRAAQPYQSDYPLDRIVAQIQLGVDTAALGSIEPETLCLWVYRDAQFGCRFFKVTPIVQQFLTQALEASDPQTYDALLKQALAVYGIPHNEAVAAAFIEMMPALFEAGILCGSQPVKAARV